MKKMPNAAAPQLAPAAGNEDGNAPGDGGVPGAGPPFTSRPLREGAPALTDHPAVSLAHPV